MSPYQKGLNVSTFKISVYSDLIEIHTFSDKETLKRDGTRRPVCYETALQPWRAWPSDENVYLGLRNQVIGICQARNVLERQILSPQLRPILAVVERGSKYRRWHKDTMEKLKVLLPSWGSHHGFDAKFVKLGAMETPCHQVSNKSTFSIYLCFQSYFTRYPFFTKTYFSRCPCPLPGRLSQILNNSASLISVWIETVPDRHFTDLLQTTSDSVQNVE